MEDVLDVYHRPHDPDRPVVCVDETSKQLIAETRVPIPAKPGQPKRCDYEYERNGTANLFMMFAPLEGWRHVKVTDRHTAVDYAQVLKELSDTRRCCTDQRMGRNTSTQCDLCDTDGERATQLQHAVH
ncbi:MAG: transposase, partial [Candidatus Korobacteraceae bacterium]